MTGSRDSSSSRAGSTLRSILSRVNPGIIDAWNGASYSNTTSSRDVFDAVHFREESSWTIQEWTDFTYEAVNLAYGDLLDQAAINYKAVREPTTTPRIVKDESALDDLTKAWACNIIRVPIKQAASVLRFRETVSQNVQVTPDPTLAPRFQWSHPLLKRTDLNPDWVVSDRSIQKTYYSAGTTDGEQDFVFAVGDSKLSQKWKSDWIQRKYAARHVDKNPAKTAKGRQHSKTHNVTAERLLPLGQLSTYCRFGETRYGFLLTQEELVAFRVRRIDGSLLPGFAGTKPCIAMEYKSVPWAESGPGKLTVDLAIWALGCMGMNDNHRIMETGNREPLESMVRLTKWTHDKAKKVYRNVISGREIPENTWKDMGKQVAFVKLDDDKDGLSYTSSFTQTNFGQGGGVAAITQGVGAVNLNTSSQDNRSQGNNGPAGADAQKAKSRGVASQQTKSPAASGHQTKSPAASGHQTKSPAAASGHQTKSPAAASGHQTKSPAAASSQRAKPSDRREADTPSKRSR